MEYKDKGKRKKGARMSKYNAKKTTIDGITFDSIKESKRYSELKLLKSAGIIKTFTLQPKFLLMDGYKRVDGKKIQPINYVADFLVNYPDGRVEIEDVKSLGTMTPVFKIKRKLLEYKYDLVLKIVL